MGKDHKKTAQMQKLSAPKVVADVAGVDEITAAQNARLADEIQSLGEQTNHTETKPGERANPKEPKHVQKRLIRIAVWGDLTLDEAIMVDSEENSRELDWTYQRSTTRENRLNGAPYISQSVQAFATLLNGPDAEEIVQCSWLSVSDVINSPNLLEDMAYGPGWDVYQTPANFTARINQCAKWCLRPAIGEPKFSGWRIVEPHGIIKVGSMLDEFSHGGRLYSPPIDPKFCRAEGSESENTENHSAKVQEDSQLSKELSASANSYLSEIDVFVVDFDGHELRSSAQPEWLTKLNPRAIIIFKYRPGSTETPHWPLWLFYWLVENSSRVICVTSANSLREDDLIISRGRSWERTFQDVITSRGRDERHQFRRSARGLIILFEKNGAAIRRRPSDDEQAYFWINRNQSAGSPPPDTFPVKRGMALERGMEYAKARRLHLVEVISKIEDFAERQLRERLAEVRTRLKDNIKKIEKLIQAVQDNEPWTIDLEEEHHSYVSQSDSKFYNEISDLLKEAVLSCTDDQYAEQLTEYWHELNWRISDDTMFNSNLKLRPRGAFLEELDRDRSRKWSLVFDPSQIDQYKLSELESGLVPGLLGTFTAWLTATVANWLSTVSGENLDTFKNFPSQEQLTAWVNVGLHVCDLHYRLGYGAMCGANVKEKPWVPPFLQLLPNPSQPSSSDYEEAIACVKDFLPNHEALEAGINALEEFYLIRRSPGYLTRIPTNDLVELDKKLGVIRRRADFMPEQVFIGNLLDQSRQYESTLKNARPGGLNPELSRFKANPWSISEYALGPEEKSVFELALSIFRDGNSAYEGLLRNLPHFRAHYNGQEYISLRRGEIEGLRDIQTRLIEFRSKVELNRSTLRSGPVLNLLCFGDPGTGKSYATRLLAREVMGDLVADPITINLSQLTTRSDLLDQLAIMQSSTARGKVPFVLFDEFDCPREGQPLGWLPFFISPMEDGSYLTKQLTLDFGAAIFVFIGSQFNSADVFGRACRGVMESGESIDQRLLDALKINKGRDFESRIDSRVTVPGINKSQQRPEANQREGCLHILQRAFILRSCLHEYRNLVGSRGDICITPNVLRAFLMVQSYYHNVRSIKKLIQTCSISRKSRFERADLPSQSQLNAHVNGAEFLAWSQKSWEFHE